MVAAAFSAEQPRAISDLQSPGAEIFTPPKGWDPYPLYVAPPLAAAEKVASVPEKPEMKKEVVVTREPGAPTPTQLGLLVDGGVPDGAGISIAYRPWTWLRLQGGGIYNTVNGGFRGGVTLLPFYSWFTPTLTVEAGHYSGGDASSVTRRFSNDPRLTNAFNVAYNFENAHLGFEVGSPRWVAFFLRAGLSYVQMTADVQPMISDATIRAQPLHIKLIMPSVKLGLVMYFF
jgi:hypothetical protein